MKRKMFAVLMTMVLVTSVVAGCGNKAGEAEQSNTSAAESQTSVTESQASVTESQTEQSTENIAQTEEEIVDDVTTQLDAIGNVEVEKNLFDVTLTIPKDFVGDVTQEELDESVEGKGYQSATLNNDGSVTYVMTKAQHKEMMDEIKTTINSALAEMVGSEDFPNITAITANDDFTSFTITTKNAEPDLAESFIVMGLYMYGGMYAIFNGETAENIHVDYVNADSGEIISSANSSEMGN